jgi:hypothetical protein
MQDDDQPVSGNSNSKSVLPTSNQVSSVASAVIVAAGTLFKKIDSIEQRQLKIEDCLHRIVTHLENVGSAASIYSSKEWYTPAEVAKLLGKKVYTVREWCRLRRINARKRNSGRGEAEEWEIPAAEVERYRNHGLLPIPLKY